MRHLALVILASTCYDPRESGGGAGTSALDSLGRVVVVNDRTTLTELGETLERHRNAIREVAGDVQRTQERVERMMPELQHKIAAVRESGRADWVEEGDTRQLEAAFVREDGVPQLGRTHSVIHLPDGSQEKVLRQGLLTQVRTLTPAHTRLRRAYLGYGLAHKMARGDMSQPFVRAAFVEFYRAAVEMPGRIGEFFARVFSNPAELKRVIGNSAGSGAELITTPTLTDIRRPTDMARRVVGLVPVRPTTTRNFKTPIVTGRAIARKRGATSNDPARFPVQTFTTADATTSVVDYVLNVLLDTNFVREGGNVLADPMGFVADWVESGVADTLEMAFLHGDSAATHQDTLATWTMGGYYTAGDLSDSLSMLKQWIGFRARAIDDSNTIDSSGSFDAADHFAALDLLGNLAADALMLTGMSTFYNKILANSLFTTVDKFGPLATLVTGQLGSVGDTPIVLSEFLRSEYASTGLYTGSGTTGQIVYTNPNAWAHYEYAGGEDDWDVTYPERGANYLGVQRSSTLAPVCLATEKPVAILRNL